MEVSGENACEWRSYSTDINLLDLGHTAWVVIQSAVFASYVTLGKFITKAKSQEIFYLDAHKSKSTNSQ